MEGIQKMKGIRTFTEIKRTKQRVEIVEMTIILVQGIKQQDKEEVILSRLKKRKKKKKLKKNMKKKK